MLMLVVLLSVAIAAVAAVTAAFVALWKQAAYYVSLLSLVPVSPPVSVSLSRWP